MHAMALGQRAQRQVLALAITTDLLELFHSGSHFLPAPDPHSMSTGASADHRTRWGQFKPSQWGQMRPSFLLPPARLALLNADQLSDDATSLNLGDHTIDITAREAALLQAHVLNARRQGHSANGPLFCHKDGTRMRPHALQQHLRRAAAETGLKLTQNWTPPLDRHHTHWMHRRGLSLQRLAGHAPA